MVAAQDRPRLVRAALFVRLFLAVERQLKVLRYPTTGLVFHGAGLASESVLHDAADVPEHKVLARITVSPLDAKIVTETTYPPPSKFLLLTLRMYGKHAAHLDVP
ncbi:hypothetical protein AcV5_001455 [Taiwanofungus camphoratus]|nr:hypothetical protein AcV5_001455 [Antrodia cinnamomea]